MGIRNFTALTIRTRLAPVSLIAIVVSGALPGIIPASAVTSCYGKSPTIVGTAGSDELIGTGGPDVIVARGGDDTIRARGGDDRVCAGDGFDLVDGGGGRDRIAGNVGGDALNGNGGNDLIEAGAGSVEALFGGRGNDRIFGGSGDRDSMIGGPGDDVMDGGPGLDLAEFFDSTGPIVAELTSDIVTGRGADAIPDVEGIVGSNFDDTITGDGGSNLLVGQEGDDVIEAGDSEPVPTGLADLIDGGPGDDVLDGADGGDVVTYDDADAAVVVDLAAGTATGWGTDTLVGIEAVLGSEFDDSISGDDGSNHFTGGPGNDAIDGRAGTDEMAYFDAFAPVVVDLAAGTSTGWGDDTLQLIEDVTGSAGDDSITGDDAPNSLMGGSGDDSLFGNAGDDSLTGEAGVDAADGGEGSDTCDAESVTGCEAASGRTRTTLLRSWLPWD